jgi:hypothetical protein
MIFAFPAAGGGVEGAQLFLPADFALGDSGQEGAALSFTEKLIDVGEQCFRERDIGALLCHGTAQRVDGQTTLHEPNPRSMHTRPRHTISVPTHNLSYGR